MNDDTHRLHKYSKHNADYLSKSTIIGCFYCVRIDITFGMISQWCDEPAENSTEAATGICPHCGIDSLLGDSCVEVTDGLISDMHEKWFAEVSFEEFMANSS